ncbi:hypothetical protein WQ57_09710 [Mesobacillus campisalis]|uniref:HicB-like antitoxin of toxin-antitoxin system domain-containing protein n=1 Tax=Mesobacillus campisalis TaxID=1408103 RepID=A0A0M2SYP2_9BACI|nr:hypothetical protein [Mesobacillus campisalis]KKK38092.1 hypothetical protein WQ57_09710 [Mesobacillus campisalis]
MFHFEKLVYPAFVQQIDEGVFGVYFPTLFSDEGWDYPLSQGNTKRSAIQNARKELAYTLAGFLYDNENLPRPIPIPDNALSSGMELLDIETSYAPYAVEIEEHLKGRHWHIGFYDEESDEYMEAIGFKNDQGMWDIYYEDVLEDTSSETLLFTVKRHSEAEEKFKQFVEEVILKREN